MTSYEISAITVFIPLFAVGVFWFILKMSEDRHAPPPPLDDFGPTWEDDPRYPGWRRK